MLTLLERYYHMNLHEAGSALKSQPTCDTSPDESDSEENEKDKVEQSPNTLAKFPLLSKSTGPIGGALLCSRRA